MLYCYYVLHVSLFYNFLLSFLQENNALERQKETEIQQKILFQEKYPTKRRRHIKKISKEAKLKAQQTVKSSVIRT